MYESFPFPYDYWSRQLTAGAVKKATSALIGELPLRLQNLHEAILRPRGFDIEPWSSNEVVNRFPKIVAAKCGFDVNYKPEGMAAIMRSKRFDSDSRLILFDSALLLGEIFRFRYPGARWSICRSPLSSVHYGRPILVNEASPKKNEFGPLMEMEGEVGGVLLNNAQREWPLVKLLQMRAFAIGLAPDPRLA